MKPLGDTRSHFWRIQRMAQVTETDLSAAMAQAELSSAEWAEMVEACRGCDWAEGCERWLAAHSAESEAMPPRTCRNRDRFERLRAALEEVKQ